MKIDLDETEFEELLDSEYLDSQVKIGKMVYNVILELDSYEG